MYVNLSKPSVLEAVSNFAEAAMLASSVLTENLQSTHNEDVETNSAHGLSESCGNLSVEFWGSRRCLVSLSAPGRCL